MAVTQLYQESLSHADDSNFNADSGRLSPQAQQNNNVHNHRISARSETRSASTKKKNKNENNTSSSRRYTSAPSEKSVILMQKSGSQPSLNVKQSVNFERNNLKSSTSSLSARTRSRSGSGRRLIFQNSDTESTLEDRSHLIIDNPYYASARSVPDLRAVSNLDFRKIASSPRNHCPCNWDLQDRDVLAQYLKQ